jgi:hypothetical protein
LTTTLSYQTPDERMKLKYKQGRDMLHLVALKNLKGCDNFIKNTIPQSSKTLFMNRRASSSQNPKSFWPKQRRNFLSPTSGFSRVPTDIKPLNNLQDKKALTHTKHNTLTTQKQNPPTLDAEGIKQNTT